MWAPGTRSADPRPGAAPARSDAASPAALSRRGEKERAMIDPGLLATRADLYEWLRTIVHQWRQARRHFRAALPHMRELDAAYRPIRDSLIFNLLAFRDPAWFGFDHEAGTNSLQQTIDTIAALASAPDIQSAEAILDDIVVGEREMRDRIGHQFSDSHGLVTVQVPEAELAELADPEVAAQVSGVD